MLKLVEPNSMIFHRKRFQLTNKLPSVLKHKCSNLSEIVVCNRRSRTSRVFVVYRPTVVFETRKPLGPPKFSPQHRQCKLFNKYCNSLSSKCPQWEECVMQKFHPPQQYSRNLWVTPLSTLYIKKLLLHINLQQLPVSVLF